MCLIQILRLYFGLTQGERHKAHDGFCSFGLGQVGFWDVKGHVLGWMNLFGLSAFRLDGIRLGWTGVFFGVDR